MITINAIDIPDAWFQCVNAVLDAGERYVVQRGSYAGQSRLEFDYITVEIKCPYEEPWDRMLPQIPSSLDIPNPVAEGYTEQYMPYLMTGALSHGEQYTYGNRIDTQIKYYMRVLKNNPATNQAILQVAQPDDYLLSDPPCLRHIDMRVKSGNLHFYPYFRSWDLWGGFPANLAGIAVLQKYMADEIGIEVGSIIAASKGLHLYGYAENLAKLRCMK